MASLTAVTSSSTKPLLIPRSLHQPLIQHQHSQVSCLFIAPFPIDCSVCRFYFLTSILSLDFFMCATLSVDIMESVSPTASASTNRGGRPKDWTVARIRRYIRLYLFTTLSREDILRLLEEDEFKPGKDAANKVKNNVLGNDPRWLRPKSEEEENNRVRGLRNLRRGRRSGQDSTSPDISGSVPGYSVARRFGTSLRETRSLGGTTIADSCRSSSDVSTAVPGDSDADASRCIPSHIGRRVSRHGTSLTNSTNSSIASSWKEKLAFLPINKAKQTFTILKRYTFPRDVESGPLGSPAFHPDIDYINDPSSAAYAVPGDFLNHELLLHRQRLCVTHSPAHLAGICWCKVAEQVSMETPWASIVIPSNLSDPSIVVKDMFGNTIFHRLAVMDGIQDSFLQLIRQALYDPRLPLRDSNTAGQTFLHVLHYSWFRNGSRLDELINTLYNGKFDLFATDVYGRSFFHLLRGNKRATSRFPAQALNYRMKRRDAFGVQSFHTQASHNTAYYGNHNQEITGISAASSRLLPMLSTYTGAASDHEYSTHASLLKVIRCALAFEGSPSTGALYEDSQGRNGFHALAEVNFKLDPGTPKHQPRAHGKDNTQSSSNGHGKRKHTEDEEIDTPPAARENQRLKYVRSLIHAQVDANQYDKQGNTPLMSFIINSSDATKYEKDETEAIIRTLVNEAGANMELRNRNGETALHLAARYSKIIALRVLLELGANPYTRNNQGLNILQVVDRLYLATEHDDKNNARYQACFAMLTSKSEHPVHGSTLRQEWGL
ncbi:hypothetical protein GGS21DRAFT_531398 [Xylaria nigripes]|nr:hypothetical protein GGS21DRAFT_531398 [Xylaria nigripes]